MEQEDGLGPESDQSKPWTLLYHAFACLEKLTEFQDQKTVVTKLVSLELPRALILFAQNHNNYWIRLICQRLVGHLFACSLSIKYNLVEMMGLQIPEQLQDTTFDIINCLFKPTQTEDLRNQLVKNLLFMVQALINVQS